MLYLFAAVFGAGVYITLFRSVRAAFVVAMVTMLLVPSSLNIPHTSSYLFTMHRVEAVVFFASMVLRSARGELRPGAFRVTGATVGLLGFVLVALIDGMFLAQRTVVSAGEFNEWTLILAQWLFFVGFLAAIREIDDPVWVAKVIAWVVVVCAGVAWGEHFTRKSYYHWLAPLLGQGNNPAAFPLELRGGHVRVRVFTAFALAFAWIMAAFLPFALVVASWARRRWWLLFPLVVTVAELWAYTRSAFIGLAAGTVLLLVGTRFDGRVTRLALAGAAVALPLLVASTLVHQTFHAPDALGSSQVRTERVPVILDAAAGHPAVGIGLSGLYATTSIGGADATHLQMYADLGVIGLLALILALLATLRSAARGLRAPPGTERALAAAAFAGLVVLIVGAGFFDQFVDLQAAEPLWLLAAFAIAIGERHVGPEPLDPGYLRPRLWMPVAGLVAGLVVFGAVPRSDAVRFRFSTVGIRTDVVATDDLQFVNSVLNNTACRLITLDAHAAHVGAVDCFHPLDYGGVGQARIAVPAPRDPTGPLVAISQRVQASLPDFVPTILDVRRDVVPAWASTAPAWGAGAGLALALFLPGSIRRRRRSRDRPAQGLTDAPDGSGDVAGGVEGDPPIDEALTTPGPRLGGQP